MDNAQLIKKADIALSDLATAGQLSPEQATTFIRTLINSPTVLSMARVVTMDAPTRKINKIGFGSRILNAAPASGTYLADNKRAKPDLGQVSLTTKEVIAEIHLPYDVIEDNIEGGNIGVNQNGASAGGLMDTLITLIAQRAALDLEELGLLGDTTSSDPYLAMFDGWIKQANANTGSFVLANGFNKDVCKNAMLIMPKPYLRDRQSLQFMTSVNNEIYLRDQFAGRNTVLGDTSLTQNQPLNLYGCNVTPAALMPDTTLLYTNPLNLIFGVQRQLTLEYQKDIRGRQFIIVLTARVALSMEEKLAAVRIVGA